MFVSFVDDIVSPGVECSDRCLPLVGSPIRSTVAILLIVIVTHGTSACTLRRAMAGSESKTRDIPLSLIVLSLGIPAHIRFRFGKIPVLDTITILYSSVSIASERRSYPGGPGLSMNRR